MLRTTATFAVLAATFAAPVNHTAHREATVAAINEAKPLWHAAVQGRFAGLPVGASKALCGAKDISEYEGEYNTIAANSTVDGWEDPHAAPPAGERVLLLLLRVLLRVLLLLLLLLPLC